MIALACALSLALQTVHFERSSIPGAPRLDDRTFADVDGDGLLDLVLAATDEPGGRRLEVRRQRADGLFPAAPDQVVAVPRAVVAWSVGRFRAGEAAAQLLFLVRDAVWLRPLDGSFVKLADAPMLFDLPARDALPWWPGVADLDGDGRDETVLPTFDGLVVFDGDGARRGAVALRPMTDRQPLAASEFLRGLLKVTLSSRPLSDLFVPSEEVGIVEDPPVFGLAQWLPAPRFADVDGDGRPELVYHFQDRVLAHRFGPDGLSEEPDWTFVLPEEGDEDSRELRFVQAGGGPGADLVLLRMGSSLTSLSSDWTVRVWLDPAERGELGSPDGFVKTRTGYLGAYFEDFDGDGRADLGVSAWDVEAGLLGQGSPTVRHTFTAYLAEPDGGWRTRPAFSERREYAVGEIEFLRDLPAFAADVTGDGRPDLVESGEGGDLLLRPIVRDGGSVRPAAEPALRLPLDAVAASVTLLDLDGDGVQDLVVDRPDRTDLYVSVRR